MTLRDANGRFVSNAGALGSFIPNPNFEAELRRSTGAKEGLEKIVEAVAADYRDGVPVDTEGVKGSIFSDVANTDDGFVGRVGATDWKAGLVELGTSKVPARPALRDAIEANGLELEEERPR